MNNVFYVTRVCEPKKKKTFRALLNLVSKNPILAAMHNYNTLNPARRTYVLKILV